jgi:malate synthase
MEDAATAEISRSQLWQWISKGVVTREGTTITRDYVAGLLAGELEQHEGGRFADAAEVFTDVTLQDAFPTFLTISAYGRYLVEIPELVTT